MHKKSINRPIGGLDVDSEARLIAQEDYRYLLNGSNTINETELAGTLTNIKGTLPITTYYYPYNGLVEPTGENIAIGSVEDTQDNSVIWFIWNSTGLHHILRHYRDLADVSNPYGVVHEIIQYDFGWERDTRITSASIVYGNVGDLLYWTDNVKPREINLTKADVVDKLKSWNLFLPVTCNFPNNVIFTFKDFAGATIYSLAANLTDPTNRETIISDIAANINNSVNCPVTAEACDCKLTFTEKVSGTVWTVESDCAQLLIPARLEGDGFWYGAVLEERFFDRAKYQFLKPNLMEFKQDSDYEPNYVQRKVFQSRLQPLYDDDSGTDLALGVWSQIGINNLGCDGTSNPLYNYIDVNFNGQNIANEQTLVILKKIRLVMREHNDGSNRSIIDLEPCDFLDYDYTNNIWVSHYKFYNDIISSAIDPALAEKLFDDVPLKADSELFTKNRMVEAGILEGYDAPACIDAKPQMEFEDLSNQRFYKIKFKIKILSWGMNDGLRQLTGSFESLFPQYRKYPFYEPPSVEQYSLFKGGIFHDTTRTSNNFPFFGGGGYGRGAGADFGIRGGMEDIYDQRIPEGGFPVYFAGTPYFSISKQINIGLPVDGVGALDTSTQQLRDNIGDKLYGSGPELYSTVEILAPAGEYVARVASHWCSFGVNGVDKLGKGFMYDLSAGTQWQKTSTNVWAWMDSSYVWHKEKEIKINVTGDIDDAGTFIIMDIAPPPFVLVYPDLEHAAWYPINAYLYNDADNIVNPNDVNFFGESVEKTLVWFDTNVSNNPTKDWGDFACTDHNGYWFGFGGGDQPDPDDPDKNFPRKNLTAYQVGNNKIMDTHTIFNGSLTDLYTKSLSPIDYNGTLNFDGGGYYLVVGIVTTTLLNSRNNCSTIINGTVVGLDTSPINGANIIYTTGRTTKSASNGKYNLLAWGDTVTPNMPKFPQEGIPIDITDDNNRINDILIFNLPIACIPDYPNGQEFSPVEIDPFGANTIVNSTLPHQPPFSPTSWFTIPNFTIDEQNNPTKKAHKRGGNYTYGLRLYDNAGRLCSVVKAFEMYVPFITEDIGKYSIEDFSGVVYPANTFKYGKPSIKWVLANTTVFPTWATTFQWMRVKNSIYGRYLQWVANQVTYLSAVATSSTPEIQTSFQNADAVAIKISISNITAYYAANNDSQVGYTYQSGDRARLIANRTLVNYQGVNDFEITSYDTTTQSIIIKPNGFPTEILSGTLFEIFNPKSVATEDEQIFYEVGETVGITNGIPDSFSGVFTNGDTYWRGRLIIVNDDATKFASAYPVVIEDASISDFYVSNDQDIGRVGIIDPNYKQLYNPSKIRFSNQYNVETAKNGLSSFEELNQKDLPREYGTIKRMMFTNNNLVCIMENKEISNYIGLVTLMQASKGAESGLVSVTDDFLGTEYIHKQMLGTDFAGSVALSNEGVIYAYNNRSASAWKYIQEETVISDVKMINYFNTLSLNGISDAVSIFDRYHEEYILTVWRKYQNESTINSVTPVLGEGYLIGVFYPTGSTLPLVGSLVEFQYYSSGAWNNLQGYVNSITDTTGGKIVNILIATRIVFTTGIQVNIICSIPETVAWNEAKQRWSSFYSFTPDCYGILRTELYSWKDGKIWIHNKNNTRNNFYGVSYNCELNVVVNGEPDLTKNFYGLYLESEQSDNSFNWSIPIVTTNTNQLSRILVNIFQKREQFYFAEMKRDLNTHGVVNPVVNGRQMRGSAMVLEMQNNSDKEVILRNIVTQYSDSARQ